MGFSFVNKNGTVSLPSLPGTGVARSHPSLALRQTPNLNCCRYQFQSGYFQVDATSSRRMRTSPIMPGWKLRAFTPQWLLATARLRRT
jgi:hypothetical protein